MSRALDSVVGLGSNLVEWILMDCADKPLKEFEYLTLMMFHDTLAKTDAVSVMVRARTAEPAKLQVRSIVEAMLCVEYLLREQDDVLARSYMLFEAIKNMKALLESKEDTDQRNLKDSFAHKDDISQFIELDLEEEQIESQIERLDRKILNPKFGKIVYEIYNNKGCRNWYTVFGGPQNLKELAKEVRLLSYYNAFYSHFSSSMHASDSLKGMFYDGDAAYLKPVRQLDNAPYLCDLLITIITRMTRKVAEVLGDEMMKVNVDYVYLSRIRPQRQVVQRMEIDYGLKGNEIDE